MKIVKPQKLGVLTRTFERQGESFFVVSPLVFFSLGPEPSVHAEADMWKLLGPELGDQVLDLSMPKVQGEVLAWAKAYPPGGAKATSVARLQLGSIDKTLYVIGDRVWKDGVPSDPVPFDEMPLTYARAFGGKGFGGNPLGLGHSSSATGGICPLPNVEDPRHLIRSQRDRPAPASFAPQDLTWPDRRGLLGTYDEKWLKECYPGYPNDIQWTAFSVAAEDQRIQGFFRGDETYVIDGMHPTKPKIQGRLPAIVTRAFVTTRADEQLREISTRLDTIWLLPHAERGVLVFRGLAHIAEDDAADVKVVLVAAEAPGQPKTLDHYREVLAGRLDRRRGAILALRDRDLMPDHEPSPPPVAKEDDGVTSEGLLRKRMRRRMERERQQIVDAVVAQGLDASIVQPLPPEPDESPPDPDAIAAQMEAAEAQVEKARTDAAARRAMDEAAAREQCAAAGIDYDAMVAASAGGGPPRVSARAELERLRAIAQLSEIGGLPVPPDVAAMLADPGLPDKLKEIESRAMDAYRRLAHLFPVAARMGPDASASLRREIVAARARGESLAERDFTGADLSELDLTRADLRGALLECANLSGAQLGGATLSGAVMARANLTKANLFASKLDGANLGDATLVDAELGEADLTRATLSKARLSKARLRNARLDQADLSECQPAGSDWSGVRAPGAKLVKLDLSGMKLAGAELTKAMFVECVADDVDATGAQLRKSTWVDVRGARVLFRDAALDEACVIGASSFVGANMSRASLARTNLRGTCLDGADLTEARMPGADLSECALRGATLVRAHAREARFVRADLEGAQLTNVDLLNGSLAKARLHGANLRGANLFQADLAGVHLDTATQLTGVNLGRARVTPARGKKT